MFTYFLYGFLTLIALSAVFVGFLNRHTKRVTFFLLFFTLLVLSIFLVGKAEIVLFQWATS